MNLFFYNYVQFLKGKNVYENNWKTTKILAEKKEKKNYYKILPVKASLSLGFFLSKHFSRSLASGDRWSGRSKAAVITLFNVLLTASVSNGGLPTRNVYNIQPKDQTSTSKPCGDLMAISLQIKISQFIIFQFY